MSNFARQSPTLALVSTFGVVLMSASGIVSAMGGSRYGGTSNVVPNAHPIHLPRGAWVGRGGGTGNEREQLTIFRLILYQHSGRWRTG
jgi:hypothetical protein